MPSDLKDSTISNVHNLKKSGKRNFFDDDMLIPLSAMIIGCYNQQYLVLYFWLGPSEKN